MAPKDRMEGINVEIFFSMTFIYLSSKICLHITEAICQIRHVGADFLIDDTGVKLSCLDIRMAQHLADRFDWNTIGESDRSREGVPGEVECHVLFNITHISDLLQIGIHLLVAQHREYQPVRLPALVFLDNRHRYLQQWDLYFGFGLLSFGYNPELTVIPHLGYKLGCKISNAIGGDRSIRMTISGCI